MLGFFKAIGKGLKKVGGPLLKAGAAGAGLGGLMEAGQAYEAGNYDQTDPLMSAAIGLAAAIVVFIRALRNQKNSSFKPGADP